MQRKSAPIRRGSQLRAYLELCRLPNVFTALADIMMGFLLTHASLQPARVFALLAAASAVLYTAGMALNDVYDVDVDRRDKPHRPLPSGRISVTRARWLGFELLMLGVALGWGASFVTGRPHSGVMATVLAACVWLYDAALKRTPIAPVLMGCCRAANVLLGISALAGSYDASHAVIAAGIGVYIVGVTWFARTEAHVSSRPRLLGAAMVMAAGIAMLAAAHRFVASPALPGRAWLILFGALGAMILARCVWAIAEPLPQRVQRAVKNAIVSLIVLDAAVVAAASSPAWSLAVLVLVLPTTWLGRWIYAT